MTSKRRRDSIADPFLIRDADGKVWLEVQWVDLCRLQVVLGYVKPTEGGSAWLKLANRLKRLSPDVYQKVARGRHRLRIDPGVIGDPIDIPETEPEGATGSEPLTGTLTVMVRDGKGERPLTLEVTVNPEDLPMRGEEASTVENPVRVAWDFYDAHPDMPRREAINAVIARGVARGTATTQHWKWSKAREAQA